MKDIDTYLDKLNGSIQTLQEEANFYLVIQLFNKLKEFHKNINKKYKTDLNLISKNSLTNPGFWLEFDNSQEDLVTAFKQFNIKIAKGINKIEDSLILPLTITENITLENFVENYTKQTYQKEFLANTLDNKLEQKKSLTKKKI